MNTAPEHITPASIYQMNEEALNTLMEQIRERRLRAVHLYEAARAAAEQATEEKARIALFKQCEMCEGSIARVDKAIDTLETRVSKIRVLRLELGLD